MGARRAVPLSLFSVYVLTVSETSTSAVPSRPIHRPRSLPPPELPGLRLPRPRRRAEGALASAVAHAVVVGLLIWRGAVLLQAGGGGSGLRGGGGGGGGGERVRFFGLPPFSTPATVDMPPAPQVSVATIQLPDPATIDLPAVEAPRLASQLNVVTGTTAGTGDGPGSGPGTGGGRGSGIGPGTGSDVGPGTGGADNYTPVPTLHGMIMPPQCVKHGRYTLKFWVAADGKVTNVEIDPSPGDVGCRQDFLERMRNYRFSPARTRDGQPAAARPQYGSPRV